MVLLLELLEHFNEAKNGFMFQNEAMMNNFVFFSVLRKDFRLLRKRLGEYIYM